MALPLPSSLSPSKVASFKDCALAFRFSAIDHLPEPPSAPATKGTLVHRALELLFCRQPAERTLPTALACLDEARAELSTHPEYTGLELTPEEEADFAADAERLLRNYFQLEDPATIRPIGLELQLEAQVGNLHLRGIIDRLELGPDGELIVTDYKGLAIDTPLPTPTGWTTMGMVEVDDFLLGADGSPTRVLEKSGVHFRPCYRIEFDDASSIVCDNEHLWSVRLGTPHNRAREKVLNADELFAVWTEGLGPITIPNTAPLDLPPAELPIDPYLLGAWLGDGSSRQGIIHICSDDSAHFVSALTARGENVKDVTWPSARSKGMSVLSIGKRNPARCNRGHADRWPDRPDGRPGDCRACKRTGIAGFPINGSLYVRLSALGLIGRKVGAPGQATPGKRVPPVYLRASRAQRLDLLRGLMDTDGYWNSGRRQAVFTTTNAQLAESVADLVCGLGARAYTFQDSYRSKRGPRKKFQVIFTPIAFNPFTLPRKGEQCTVRARPPRAGRRAIRKIERVPTVPTQCVLVDAVDSLYLAGRQMVPTHNTGKSPNVKYEQGRLGGVHFYAFLCQQVLGRRPARVQLLYLSEPLAIIAEPSEQSVRGLEQRTAAIWTAVERACEREDFRPRVSPLCDWCSFRAYCPAWGGDPAAAGELLPAGTA